MNQYSLRYVNSMPIHVFHVGDRIYCDAFKKHGKIISIRDESYERQKRKNDPNHPFYYHIQFDDGSFDTYVSGNFMVKTYD